MAQVDTQNNPNDPNNPNNPAQQPNQQPAAQGANQPATSGGAGAVTSTGAGNVTGQVVGTNNPSQPFQNISSYLAANAPQSEALAGQVAGSVSQPIQQTAKDIANSSQNFMNSVNAGYTPEDKNAITTAAANPVAAANDPNSLAAFQKQLNDAYTGPTDFSTDPAYSGFSAEIANAQGLGTSAQTPTGIQTLLQGIEGQTMTGGINNLDTLLLAQNPQNFQTIQNAGRAANNSNNALGNFLNMQTSQDNAAAASAGTNAQQAAKDASGALNTAAGNVASPVNAQFENDLTNTENYNSNLQSIINAVGTGNLANLTSTQQQEIGFDPRVLTALAQYPDTFTSQARANMPNPSIYYSGPGAAILPTSPAQTETPQQAAAVAALQALNGGASLGSLDGLLSTAPSTPFSVPTDYGKYDNVQLADFLYNALAPLYSVYQQTPGQPPVTTGGVDINQYMQMLEQLTNQTPSQPTPVTGPLLGPPNGDVRQPTPVTGPFLGPPGGDVR